MHRRDIFNLFFKGTSMDTSVLSAIEPPLDLSTYFKKDDSILVNQEWNTFNDQNRLFSPDISPAYEFSIILDLNYSDCLSAICRIGIKEEDQPSTFIAIGYNESRKLFIGEKVDDRILPLENLKNGCQLVLSVNPLKNGMTHAKLKAIDPNGLTLSIIKSDNNKLMDWTGDIDVSQLNCNLLRVHGCKSI